MMMHERKMKPCSLSRVRLAFFAMVLLGLYAFHAPAVGRELRHTRVAEGNISHAVHAILSRGVSGYGTIARSDACNAGRIRPLHWLYHGTSFLLTMVRNGDMINGDPDVRWQDRMNGDLQTHSWMLLLSVAAAVALMGWTGAVLCRKWWVAVLFPLVFLSAPRYLNENLLVNYCDSGEIGQLLLICAYLAAFHDVFQGRVPGRRHEIVGTVFLVLAYAMKETSIVLLPAMAGLLAGRMLSRCRTASEFRRFTVRHALVHILLAAVLLVAVLLFRSGGYVSANFEVDAGLGAKFLRSWRILTDYTRVVPYCVAGGLLFLVAGNRASRLGGGTSAAPSGTTGLIWVGGALMAGFWAVNVPWNQPLIKYYLSAFFFGALASAALCAGVWDFLRKLDLKPAALLWLSGSGLLLVEPATKAYSASHRYYEINYGCRRTVPLVVGDLASRADGQRVLRAHLVAGFLFQEGELPFCRMLNRQHRMNLAQAGQPVCRIRACEQNYLRIHPGRPLVEIFHSIHLPASLDAEFVYVWDGVLANEAHEMAKQGYRQQQTLSVGSPAWLVHVYQRGGKS